MKASGMVLVTGATGGVGRRVVDILRNKGVPVRVLVLLFDHKAPFLFSFSELLVCVILDYDFLFGLSICDL